MNKPAHYDTVRDYIKGREVVGVSELQRRLRISYVSAARVLEALEDDGLVGPMRPPYGLRAIAASAPRAGDGYREIPAGERGEGG